MFVKVAPIGERTIEVNLNGERTVAAALAVAEIPVNGRKIILNNKEVDETAEITEDNSIIVLAQKMKGGK